MLLAQNNDRGLDTLVPPRAAYHAARAAASEVLAGRGRIAAVCHCSSASYQIRERIRCLCF
jgi:hypothetical protein